MQPPPVPGLRLDKWLYQARVFKTRGLAAERIGKGGIRLNGQRSSKPGKLVRIGDELVISVHGHVRVLRVTALGERRGPACEAQTLYQDLSDSAPDGLPNGLIDPREGTR
ncbi:MAG: RNA-binding S4 domain-containing protein [Paracoccus sp. (in: a-proteobacteria)]|uniref:RNA-binding S4 domain-containing protein n=1 Tax=Paracoccus sp. TaxID=267 RepID=UPI00391D15DC